MAVIMIQSQVCPETLIFSYCNRLPEGLSGVGMGLGSNGNPLMEVAKNINNQVWL
jgi:hypothetical protein